MISDINEAPTPVKPSTPVKSVSFTSSDDEKADEVGTQDVAPATVKPALSPITSKDVKVQKSDGGKKDAPEVPVAVVQEDDPDSDLKEKAKAIFMHMKAEADELASDQHEDDLEALISGEADVDDVANQLYTKQIEQLKEDQQIQDEEKNQEIAELKNLLAQADKRNAANANETRQVPDAGMKEPIVQAVSLNGMQSKLLICDFNPGQGRIGISFKRYGSQFFIIDTLPNGQCSKYKGIGPGLLLYRVVSFDVGSSSGHNISVSHSDELAQKIFIELGKGKRIQMSFLILPENVHIPNIQQHVLKTRNNLIVGGHNLSYVMGGVNGPRGRLFTKEHI